MGLVTYSRITADSASATGVLRRSVLLGIRELTSSKFIVVAALVSTSVIRSSGILPSGFSSWKEASAACSSRLEGEGDRLRLVA